MEIVQIEGGSKPKGFWLSVIETVFHFVSPVGVVNGGDQPLLSQGNIRVY